MKNINRVSYKIASNIFNNKVIKKAIRKKEDEEERLSNLYNSRKYTGDLMSERWMRLAGIIND